MKRILFAFLIFSGLLLSGKFLPAQDSGKVDTALAKAQPKPGDFLYQDETYYYEEEYSKFSLRSPYHAFLTHLHYLEAETYHPDSAAMALNFRNPRSKKAQDHAIKLNEIYEARGLYIDPEMLPRDPDYVDSLSGKNIYRPFPKYKDIYLVKIGNRWVYSRFTVQSILRIHREVFPLGTTDWVPDWSRKPFAGLELWQWLGVALFVILSWVLHKIFMLAGGVLIRWIARGFSKEAIAYQFFQNVARPFSFLALCGLLMWMLPLLALPVLVNKYIILVLRILMPAFFVMVLYYLVDVLMAYMAKRAEKTPSTLDDYLMPLIRKLIKAAVIVTGFLMILANLDVNITAVLAGLSIGGIAVALAAQDTVKNLFGSLMIYIDRPFKVGDWIIVGDIEGVVEEIGVRSTRIRTFADSLTYIPNGRLADSNVNNMGLRVYRRLTTIIGVSYETPNELVEIFTDGIRDIILSHPHTRKDETFVNLHELGPYSMNIRIIMYFKVGDTLTESNYRQDMLFAILRLAARMGIEIAMPTQILHLDTVAKPGEPEVIKFLTPQEAKAKADAYVNELKAELYPEEEKKD